MLSRRDFLKALGVLGGVILAPLQWITKVQAISVSEKPLPPGAELYGQFLLLPEGTPTPDFVQDYKFGIPSMCGITEEGTNEPAKRGTFKADYSNLDNAKDLSMRGRFPVYTLSRLPAGISPSKAGLIKHKTGEVFGGDVTFKAYDEQEGIWYTAINISAQIDYPRPFPLWFSSSIDPDTPAVVLEKVDFTPGHNGILVHTRQGFALHWIDRNTYFLMTGDRMPDVDARELASALSLAS